MWSIGSSNANFTMEAHDKGVNYVDFYPGADKPYFVTADDDKTVKVWDYLSKSCVQTVEVIRTTFRSLSSIPTSRSSSVEAKMESSRY